MRYGESKLIFSSPNVPHSAMRQSSGLVRGHCDLIAAAGLFHLSAIVLAGPMSSKKLS
jgi:hypothetical protein